MPNTLKAVIKDCFSLLIQMNACVRIGVAGLLLMAVMTGQLVSQGANESPCQEDAQENERLHSKTAMEHGFTRHANIHTGRAHIDAVDMST